MLTIVMYYNCFFGYSKEMTKSRRNYIIFIFICIRYSLTFYEEQEEKHPFKTIMPHYNMVFQ